MAIDSSDNIHVVWNEQSVGNYRDIKYRKRTSGVWGTEQAVTDADTVDVDSYGFPLLSLDTSDNAYVVYQFDQTAVDQTVWYNQVVSEVVSSEIVLDSTLLQPNTYPSTYSILWHRFPSSGILTPSQCPTVILLDENGTNADIYYESFVAGEGAGVVGIVYERLHYVGLSGQEYYIQGTPVP